MERLFNHFSPLRLMLGLILLVSIFNVAFAQDAQFNPTDLFPSWDEEVNKVQGVAGENTGEKNKLFLQIVPVIIDLLLKFAAPAAFIMMVFAGIRFIYANDNEEERGNAQKFFMYTAIGLLIIVLSYSIMRAVYFIYVG